MIKFADLWREHPYVQLRDAYPCKIKDKTGSWLLQHQCAVNLGIALRKGGKVSFVGYSGSFCWQHAREHPLKAEELARWLTTQPGHVGTVSKTKSAKQNDFLGKTGIILCKDFWGTGNTGDHIDLWDGIGAYSNAWDPSGQNAHPTGYEAGKNLGEPGFAHGKPGWIDASKEVWFWQLF